jgi:glycerol-3-phosphate dehydrogenase (NAD(P)+)
VGVVSGPSFAEEVARGLPTALAVAATAPGLAADVAALLRGETLRAYESDDIAGVETGGAVKNVLAIAAGASDGLGFGHNARAALITRGLAETARLAVALGGRRETMMGLAGLGDLVLTCTGDLSRNRRVGLALAKGRRLPEILADLGHVAEGVHAARAVRVLAARHGIDMPIAEAVDRALHEDLPVRDAVVELLRREPRPEAH